MGRCSTHRCLAKARRENDQVTPTVTTNLPEFQAALREWAATTTRELSKALNARMFYVLLRAYILMSPRDPAANRARVKSYLNAVRSERYKAGDATPIRFTKSGRVIGKGAANKLAKSRQLLRVYLIAQSIRIKKGLPALNPRQPKFAELMKKNVAKLRRRGAAQGYVKASIVKALKALNGGFAQWGFAARFKGAKANRVLVKAEVAPNAALAKIAGEYGISNVGNVGLFKTSKGAVKLALPGLTPSVVADITIKVRSGEDSAVQQQLDRAINQAFVDETAAIRQHLAARAQEVANAYSA